MIRYQEFSEYIDRKETELASETDKTKYEHILSQIGRVAREYYHSNKPQEA